jgi:type IV pilus assembly protein PilB
MKIAPFLAAAVLNAILAQRLVRRICEACREPIDTPEDLIEELFERDTHTQVKFYRGRGCNACGGTGFYGRIALHETLMFTDELRQQISQRATAVEIAECALRTGYKPLRWDGLKKVLRGLTTLEELERVSLD